MRLSTIGLAMALSGVLSTGCAYKVELSSAPIGARVDLPNGKHVFTPDVVKLRVAPFKKQEVTVSSPGYRPLTVDLRQHELRFWRYLSDALFRPATWTGAPRGHLELRLVPQHGPAGTWSVESESL